MELVRAVNARVEIVFLCQVMKEETIDIFLPEVSSKGLSTRLKEVGSEQEYIEGESLQLASWTIA